MRFMYVAEDPWVRTDFDTRCVPLNEFYLGADSKDAIPPIDSPLFVPAVGADEWLHPMEPVLVVSRDDVARAYSLQLLLFHEMVNDSIDGFPFLVTYCPLCNTALVFERSVGGQVYDFGTSGLLRGSDLVMYDRQTDSWWQQLTGEALVGAMSGSVLTPIAAQQVTWSAFKQAYPGGLVLSRETGYQDQTRYGTTPYTYYETERRPNPEFWTGETDDRLTAMTRVSTIGLSDARLAVPFYVLAGQRIVVFYNPDTLSVLGEKVIASARPVGSTGVFMASVAGRDLTFRMEDGDILDDAGDQWSSLGEAVSGPLKGTRLTPVVHTDGFWFSWAAFNPGTAVYLGG